MFFSMTKPTPSGFSARGCVVPKKIGDDGSCGGRYIPKPARQKRHAPVETRPFGLLLTVRM